MAFRIRDIEIHEKNLNTKNISLIDRDENSSQNHFTVLIGENGTGKSRILGHIARKYSKMEDNEESRLIDSKYFGFPRKVIAISNSISDKFPVDKTFRPSKYRNQILKYSELSYVYLGTRNKIYSHSSTSLLNRTLDILIENYSDKSVALNYRHIFEYLNYEPVIKVEFSFSRDFRKYVNDRNSEFYYVKDDIILDYLKDEARMRNTFRSEFIEEFISEYVKEIPKLRKFIIKNFEGNQRQNLLINFSESNIERFEDEKSIYYRSLDEYRLIGLLKKLRIIDRTKVKVYKRTGSEFYFNDASSGEAHILSTLIGVIPLIKNNSLVLIDEPEISLHPNWQYKYVYLLQRILKHVKGCHIIIASHSHLIVSDLPIENSTVVVLRESKQIIHGETLEGTTFGQSAEDILLNIFGLPTTRNYYLSKQAEKALELLANHERSSKELKSIQAEFKIILPLLKEHDPLKDVLEIIVKDKVNE